MGACQAIALAKAGFSPAFKTYASAFSSLSIRSVTA